MPRYYARRRRRPQSSRSVGACRRPDAPYGRTPRSLKVFGQHLEGGQPNSSVRRRRTSRRDVVLTCRDASRRVLNRVGCCCLLSHSHAFTDDHRAPDRLTCPPQAHPRPPRRSPLLAARPPCRSPSSPLVLLAILATRHPRHSSSSLLTAPRRSSSGDAPSRAHVRGVGSRAPSSRRSPPRGSRR